MKSQEDSKSNDRDQAHAAVSIILASGQEGESVLLIRRATHPGDPWSGHLAFPGGKIDPDDLSPLDAAIRETKEECGIQLSEKDCVERSPLAEAGHYSGRVLRVLPFAFYLEKQPPLNPDPTEVESAFWLPLSKFMDFAEHHSHCFHPVLKTKKFSHVHIGGTRLWGFTYEQLGSYLMRRGFLGDEFCEIFKK